MTTRTSSGPELRAERLITLLDLALARNDGSRQAQRVYLRMDRKGTSVIRGETLYTDVPVRNKTTARPKNFRWITPDYSGERCFIEVKGDVSGGWWEGLSRDSCNDNLRFALLRMRAGAIDDMRVEYRKLDRSFRRIADKVLAPFPMSQPEDRVYLGWDDLKRQVASPDENLQRTVFERPGLRLPIKVVAGVQETEFPPLYILDCEIMKEWEEALR